MPKKSKYGIGVYEYLESIGVLANGSDFDITRCKEKYWKEYRKQWKKSKRLQSKSYEVQFSFKENHLIASKAEQHSLSITSFIKQLAIASSTDKSFIDQKLIGEIREAVIQHHTTLLELQEENELPKSLTQLINEAEHIETKMNKLFSLLK